MQPWSRDATLRDMRTTYGVVWRAGEHPLARGKLELLARVLRLDGVTGEERVALDIPYEDLDGVHVGRTLSERLNGHPTIVLEPRGSEPIVVSTVAQAGVIAEITERIAKLTLA
jgi:hypothetical protein